MQNLFKRISLFIHLSRHVSIHNISIIDPLKKKTVLNTEFQFIMIIDKKYDEFEKLISPSIL